MVTENKELSEETQKLLAEDEPEEETKQVTFPSGQVIDITEAEKAKEKEMTSKNEYEDLEVIEW